MDSVLLSACRLLPESVFHLSIRSLAKSTCAACDADSRSASNPLSWLAEEYETGPCGAAALDEMTCALIARQSGARQSGNRQSGNRQSGNRDKHRRRNMEFCFIKVAV